MVCVCVCVSGSTGDSLEVWQELDLECVEKDLRGVLSRGITSLAVLLLHSYTSVSPIVSLPLGIFTQAIFIDLLILLPLTDNLSMPGKKYTWCFFCFFSHCSLILLI